MEIPIRIPLRIFIATLGLVSCAPPEAPPVLAAATVAPDETESIQIGKWAPRSVRHFPVRFYTQGLSALGDRCAYATHVVRNILVQLGARASDFHVDACQLNRDEPTIDATFSVLVPADKSDPSEAIVVAHWQSHEWKGELNCLDIGYIEQNILPLFSTKDVQLLSRGSCHRDSVALRAEFLTESQFADTP
ncbi:MAG TPA: hypothetical protein VIY90_05955 [Steroidobacteraceae bacterium]